MLDFQLVDIKFTQGQDTRTNRKLVLPTSWRRLENCGLGSTDSLVTRPGLLGVAETLGNGLATHNDELLVTNAGTISTISTRDIGGVTTPTASTITGELGFVDVDYSPLVRANNMQRSTDCDYGNSATCYAWVDVSAAGTVTGVSVMVTDEATGARRLGPTVMRSSAGVFNPRVVFSNGAFFVFYIDASVLYCRVITCGSTGALSALGAETTLVSSASLAGLNFDAVRFAEDPGVAASVAVAYGWADGVTSVRCIGVTNAGTTPSIANGPVNVIPDAQINIADLTGIGLAWSRSYELGQGA